MRYTARVPFGNVAWDTRIPGGGDLGFRVAGGGDLGLRVGMLGGNPRMAREIGAPRGRRVGSGPKCPSRTTIRVKFIKGGANILTGRAKLNREWGLISIDNGLISIEDGLISIEDGLISIARANFNSTG